MSDDETTRQRVLVDPNDETRGYLLRRDGQTEVVRVEHPDDVLNSLGSGLRSEIDELEEEHKRRAAENGAPPAIVDMIGRGPADVGTVDPDRWGVVECPDCGAPCHESWDECGSCDRPLQEVETDE